MFLITQLGSKEMHKKCHASCLAKRFGTVLALRWWQEGSRVKEAGVRQRGRDGGGREAVQSPCDQQILLSLGNLEKIPVTH